MTNQDPNSPEEYLRRLQADAAAAEAKAVHEPSEGDEPTQPYGTQPPSSEPSGGDNPYGQPQGQPYGHQAPGQPPYGQSPYGQSPYGQPPYGSAPSYGQQPSGYPGYQPTLPTHPSSTTALVLGIIGLASVVVACGVGLVVSPFAWRMGAKAVQEIDANPGRYSGRENANAGRITGLIGTILLVIFVVGAIALMALLVALEPSTTTSEPYYGNV